jgi:hypothetical protein
VYFHSLTFVSPTRKVTEGRAPVWGFEFTTKAPPQGRIQRKSLLGRTYISGFWCVARGCGFSGVGVRRVVIASREIACMQVGQCRNEEVHAEVVCCRHRAVLAIAAGADLPQYR